MSPCVYTSSVTLLSACRSDSCTVFTSSPFPFRECCERVPQIRASLHASQSRPALQPVGCVSTSHWKATAVGRRAFQPMRRRNPYFDCKGSVRASPAAGPPIPRPSERVSAMLLFSTDRHATAFIDGDSHIDGKIHPPAPFWVQRRIEGGVRACGPRAEM